MLIITIIAISILILVHEWGHFFAARRLGVRVEEFGFGFPPRIYSRIKNGVRYSLNALPFGGFVKIFGERGEGAGDTTSFISHPVWQRAVILAAGIGMNIAAAWVLFGAASAIGVPRLTDDRGAPVSVLGVIPGSPAEQAGLKLGDQILELRGPEVSLRVEKEGDIGTFANAYRGEEITLVIMRRGSITRISITPRIASPAGEGPLGIAIGRLSIERTSWWRAPAAGFSSLTQSIGAIAGGLWALTRDLASSGRVSGDISGPVGILLFARDSGALGAAYFLQFIGVLSVNLAVLNVLPIPALDGGRLLFLVLEKIKGRRISPRLEDAAHTAGFVLLVILMIAITYRDIARLW